MTQREFLESNGYHLENNYLEENNVELYIYVKYFEFCSLYIRLSEYDSNYYVQIDSNTIENQEVISDLQEAWNTVKKDFEDMSKYPKYIITRTEFLKSKGFKYNEKDRQWVRGDSGVSDCIIVLDFNKKENSCAHIDSFDISLELDSRSDLVSFITSCYDELEEIYNEAVKLND